MNFMMQAGMNQMKSQAQNLIPKDMKEGNNENPENQNQSAEGKIENSGASGQPHPPKKKKSKIITRILALKMYTVLLIHTAILTIAVYIINANDAGLYETDAGMVTLYWILFGASIGGCLILSLLLTKITCMKSPFFIYILYLIILGLDAFIFILGAHLLSFDIFVSMLIVFDGASIVVIIFCSLIKDHPSTFWVMCSSSGGIILAVFLSTKLYEDLKMLVLIFGVYSFVIYQVMNYNIFNTDSGKKKKSANDVPEQEPALKIPPMMLLPFEFNAAFIKMFILIIKGIIFLIKGCIGGGKKK